jgi:hypothetical protein
VLLLDQLLMALLVVALFDPCFSPQIFSLRILSGILISHNGISTDHD